MMLLVVGIRARKLDARGLADEAATAIAADEVLAPQRPAVAERDIDAGLVLREAGHLDAALGSARRALRPSPRGSARYASATARAL